MKHSNNNFTFLWFVFSHSVNPQSLAEGIQIRKSEKGKSDFKVFDKQLMIAQAGTGAEMITIRVPYQWEE